MGGPTDDPAGDFDLAVIGAGILGLAVARELMRRRPGARLVVLERETDVAAHQTGHNSGVIHAGIYYPPGSLKARLCVEGARAMYDFCAEHGIRAEACGKLIVATSERELPALDELERRGRANGVPGLRRLTPAEAAEIEPHVRAVAALHSPATGVVDFAAVARALAADVEAAGGVVATGCEVEALEPGARALTVRHARGSLRARFCVACAGAWSDRLARRAGAAADPRIVPFRGAYKQLRPERARLVRALVYPVPDPALPFLGVHLSRHGNEVLVGPTALLAGARDAYSAARVSARDLAETLAWPGTWRLLRRFWRSGVRELAQLASERALARAAARLVPGIEARDLLPGPAGVRAQALARDGSLLDDFAFSATPRALHVRNAPSPGATAALAIAREIADRAERELR